jgi:ATP-dependent Clp protease ATP-binding subunit ClpX
MVTVLADLTESQLVSILTETKNALTKQYAKLMAMEGVELEFTPEALRELAKQGDQERHWSTGVEKPPREIDVGRHVRCARK